MKKLQWILNFIVVILVVIVLIVAFRLVIEIYEIFCFRVESKSFLRNSCDSGVLNDERKGTEVESSI